MYFVKQTLQYQPKNRLQAEALKQLIPMYDRQILEDDALDQMTDQFNKQVNELNAQFPQCKGLIAETSKRYSGQDWSMEVPSLVRFAIYKVTGKFNLK